MSVKIIWKAIGSTDIGGGRENQDDFFVWENPSAGLMVMGVLDGHGRDVGKVAAVVGREFLLQYCETHQEVLQMNPYDFLVNGIVAAHQAIKEGFIAALTDKEFEIEETPEKYLVKRKKNSKGQWMCVHGGTSCSLVALVGTKLFTGNVGDSTGILCTSHPVLSNGMLKFVGDAGDVSRKASSMSASSTEDTMSNTLVITADHSPESPSEFCRMRSFRQREGDPKQPALLVVYDASQPEKSRCPSVFELDETDQPRVTNRGSYYKNVRREWASLVAAPASAKFQDALAFTRSIGDFHLHIYGVSELPEVHCVDLKPIFENLSASGAYQGASGGSNIVQTSPGKLSPMKTSTSLSPMRLGGRGLSPSRISPMEETVNTEKQVDSSQFPCVAVVLASDGIWDNWEYHDVSNFVMNPANSQGGAGSGVGIDKAAIASQSLIDSNAVHAKRNFGNQADNATGIVLFIQPLQLPL